MNQISSEEGSSSSTSLRGIAFLACLATAGLLGSLLIIQTLHFLKDGHMDFYVFYTAAMRLRTDVDIFLPVEMSENYYLWYIYPPFLAVLFLPLTYLSLETAAATFNIINGLLILACLWLGGREVLRRTKGRLDVATLPVVICLATVFLFPRIKAELDQGQTDMIVLLGMLLSLFWIKRHPWLAGIALGLVANIKYQTVIFVPYFIVRQWWPAVGGFSFGAVIAGLSGALIVGWERNLDYLKRAFAGMGQMIGVDVKSDVLPDIYAVDWLGSISAMSTSARWSESLGGGTGVFILLVGLVALACFLIGWWCYKANGQRLFVGRNGIKGRQDSRQETLVMLEWLGLIMAALAFGPQTKMRHMIIVLPIVLLAIRYLVVQTRGVARWPVLLALVLAFFFQLWPFDGFGSGGMAEKIWRYNGGPIWFFLLLYFTVLWAGLRTLTLQEHASIPAADAG